MGEVALRQVPGFTNKNWGWTFWHGAGYLVPYVDERGRVTGIQVRWLDRPDRKYETPALHDTGRARPGRHRNSAGAR